MNQQGGVYSYIIPEDYQVGTPIKLTAVASLQGENDLIYSDPSEIILNVVEKPGTISIVFKDESDASAELTNNSFNSHVESGADLVKSVTDISKVYQGAKGIKFSSSSANGKITINLASKLKVSNVIIKGSAYGSDAASLKVNNISHNLSDNGVEYAINGEIESLTFEATKRLYVKEIIFTIDSSTTNPQPSKKDAFILWGELYTDMTVQVGETKTLKLSIEDEDGKSIDVPFYFTSSNPNVLTVNASGEITGVAEGTATITVQLYDDEETYQAAPLTLDVTVIPAPITECAAPTFSLTDGANVYPGDKVTFSCTTPGAIIALKVNDQPTACEVVDGVYTYTIPADAKVGSSIKLSAIATVEEKGIILESAEVIINLNVIEKPKVAIYKQVKNVSELIAGKKYVIANTGTTSYAMSTEENANTRKSTEVEVKDGLLIGNDDVMVFTLKGETDNWSWYAPDYKGANKYLKPIKGDTKVEMTANPYATKVTFSIQGNVQITTTLTGDDRNVKFYTSGSDFRYYGTSNGASIQLYMLEEPEIIPTPLTLSWADEFEDNKLNIAQDETKVLGIKATDADGNSVEVGYKLESSDAEIVDFIDNELMALAPGTVTVTASLLDEDTYTAAPLTLEVTVIAPAPTKVATPVAKVGDRVIEDETVIYVDETIILSCPTPNSTITYEIDSEYEEFDTVEESDSNIVEININKPGIVSLEAVASAQGLEDSDELNLAFTVSKRPSEIKFATDEVKAYLDAADSFVAPVLINPNNFEVTYSSSDPEIASVDPKTGIVTIESEGETMISVNYAGSEIYEKTEDIYILTVLPVKPQTSVVTFDFVNETYGMTRLSGNTTEYNPEELTVFNNEETELIAITVKNLTKGSDDKIISKNRLWKDGWRFYGNTNEEYDYSFSIGCEKYEIGKIALTGTLINSGIVSAEGYDSETKEWSGTSHNVEFTLGNKGDVKYIATISVSFEHDPIKKPILAVSGDGMKLTLSHEDGHSIWYRFVTPVAENAPARVAADGDFTKYDGEEIDLTDHMADKLEMYAQHPDGMVSETLVHNVNDVVTGITDIADDIADGEAWFNLQGVRVAAPTKGIFIRIKNGKAEKVVK